MTIEVQGHRGARGLAPENTLAGFEIALDVGVMSIETDVHLTKDDVVVLCHDARINPQHFLPSSLRGRGAGGEGEAPEMDPLVRSLSLEQLRTLRVLGPPSPLASVADWFARERGIDPCGIPTLAELFDLVAAYAGPMGAKVGKTPTQQENARRLILDIELKRVPFEPETIGDSFTGDAPALLERQVIAEIRAAGVLNRTRVRSFDHRSLRAIRQLEPTLPIGLLIYNTAPASIADLRRATGAEFYCPDYRFVDAEIVREAHAVGMRIITYTVNDAAAWDRLVAWGVDGITTDYPDRLIGWLRSRFPSSIQSV